MVKEPGAECTTQWNEVPMAQVFSLAAIPSSETKASAEAPVHVTVNPLARVTDVGVASGTGLVITGLMG
jgi:hypothetical protein